MAEYINRYAFLNALDDAIAHNALSYEGCVNDIMTFIAKIPAADVQPVKHGEWLEREQVADIQIDEWQSCRCSVCKKYHTTPFLYYFNNYNYCPNCGTKMDGGT